MRLHEWIDERFGTGDVRLVYGITVPLLVCVVSIALFAWVGEWWLLVPTILAVILLTGVVAIGISQMLGEGEGESESDPGATPKNE